MAAAAPPKRVFNGGLIEAFFSSCLADELDEKKDDKKKTLEDLLVEDGKMKEFVDELKKTWKKQHPEIHGALSNLTKELKNKKLTITKMIELIAHYYANKPTSPDALNNLAKELKNEEHMITKLTDFIELYSAACDHSEESNDPDSANGTLSDAFEAFCNNPNLLADELEDKMNAFVHELKQTFKKQRPKIPQALGKFFKKLSEEKNITITNTMRFLALYHATSNIYPTPEDLAKELANHIEAAKEKAPAEKKELTFTRGFRCKHAPMFISRKVKGIHQLNCGTDFISPTENKEGEEELKVFDFKFVFEKNTGELSIFMPRLLPDDTYSIPHFLWKAYVDHEHYPLRMRKALQRHAQMRMFVDGVPVLRLPSKKELDTMF